MSDSEIGDCARLQGPASIIPHPSLPFPRMRKDEAMVHKIPEGVVPGCVLGTSWTKPSPILGAFWVAAGSNLGRQTAEMRPISRDAKREEQIRRRYAPTKPHRPPRPSPDRAETPAQRVGGARREGEKD